MIQFEVSVKLIKDTLEREGKTRIDSDALALARWHDTSSMDRDTHLAPQLSGTGRYRKILKHQGSHINLTVADCRRICSKNDLQFLVVDLTRPETGICAARVLVPGLRHFWARFAPGRLYDIPVALKRVGDKPKEEDLNPVPIMF